MKDIKFNLKPNDYTFGSDLNEELRSIDENFKEVTDNLDISELEVAEILTGEELIPIVQGGQNKAAKVKTINTSFVQELTLAELQAIQFSDAPAPMGITITPDAVGDNPHSIFFKIAFTDNDTGYVTLPTNYIEVIIGDDTSEVIISKTHDFSSNYGGLIIFKGNSIHTYDSFYDGWILDDLPQNIFPIEFANASIEYYYTNTRTYQIQNSLIVGQQYYVTDKQWLLYVDSPTVLKPVKGSLHIFNGETLPEGIEPDVLFIDTGVVESDLSINQILLAPIPQSYYLKGGQGKNYGAEDGFIGTVLINDNEMNVVCSISSWQVGYYDNIFSLGEPLFKNGYYYAAGDFTINGTDSISSKKRFILELHRSELSLPIPVPHIVSAETLYSNTISVNFDSPLNITTSVDSDMIIKINGIQASYDSQEVDDNILNYFIAETINNGDIITLFYNGTSIKNIWGGLLARVVDYPVVNNVPALTGE